MKTRGPTFSLELKAAIFATLALAPGLQLTAANRATAAPPPRQAGAATPQVAWEQARIAYGQGDFRTFIESVSPDARDEQICQIAFLMAMAWGDDESGRVSPEEKGANEIMRRYGLTELPPKPAAADSKQQPGLSGPRAIHRIEDKVGFYSEMMTYLSRNAIGPTVPAWLSAELTDVKITGAKATANGGSQFGEISFDKQANAWLIHPPPVCLKDLPRDEQTEQTSDQHH
jgi:hypothetical protein